MSTAQFVVRYENCKVLAIVSDHGVTTAFANHEDCPECADTVLELDDSEFMELITTDGMYCHISFGEHGLLVNG